MFLVLYGRMGAGHLWFTQFFIFRCVCLRKWACWAGWLLTGEPNPLTGIFLSVFLAQFSVFCGSESGIRCFFDSGSRDGIKKSGSVIWDEHPGLYFRGKIWNFFSLYPEVTEYFGTDPESGSVSQRFGSEDPDLYQNVTDPENCC